MVRCGEAGRAGTPLVRASVESEGVAALDLREIATLRGALRFYLAAGLDQRNARTADIEALVTAHGAVTPLTDFEVRDLLRRLAAFAAPEERR